MTLDVFWNSFVTYPNKLEYYDADIQEEDVIRSKTDMDSFVCDNADKEVRVFIVDFDEKSICVELGKKNDK